MVSITALATALVAVGATLALTGAFTPTPTFDEVALEDGVRGVLQDDFGLSDVGSVSCPANLEVVAGTEFECSFRSGGQDVSIPIEVLNDAGQYRVGGPESEAKGADDAG